MAGVLPEDIEQAAEVLGVSLSPGARRGLEILLELWGRYGRAIRLTASPQGAGLNRQVIEGLVAVACVEGAGITHGRWLDVGSGGGFPGLVVGAVAPWSLVLVEPREKRASFLVMAARAIGVHATVVRARLTDGTWEKMLDGEDISALSRPFEVASARAVMDPARWVSEGLNHVVLGGLAIAHMRSDDEEVAGRTPVRRVDLAGWSVRAYRRDG